MLYSPFLGEGIMKGKLLTIAAVAALALVLAANAVARYSPLDASMATAVVEDEPVDPNSPGPE